GYGWGCDEGWGLGRYCKGWGRGDGGLTGWGWSSLLLVLGFLRNGRDIRFWVDHWVDNRRLCNRFLRGRVSKEFEDLLGILQHVVLYNNCRDRWRWTLGEDGEFTVGNVNAFTIDEFFSSNGNVNVPVYYFRVWQAVMWTTGSFIWKEGNSRVFGNRSEHWSKTGPDQPRPDRDRFGPKRRTEMVRILSTSRAEPIGWHAGAGPLPTGRPLS
nr:hypothetical protein [Tanacetum cinerariifolium]